MSRDGSLDTTKLLNATHEVSVETDDGTLNGNIISSNPLSLWQTAYNYLFFAYHGNVGVVRLSLGIVISIFALAVVMLVWLFVNSRRMRKLLK